MNAAGVVLVEVLSLALLTRMAVVYHRESRPQAPFVYEPLQVRPALPLDRRNRHGEAMRALRNLIASMSVDDRPPDSDLLVFAEFGQDREAMPEPPDLVEPVVEIVAPPGYEPAPPVRLRTRKAHEDWPWDTAEIEMRWQEHFADQPDDRAVMKVGSHRA